MKRDRYDELDLISDRIRLAYLKTPDTKAASDDLNPAKTDELLEDNNFVSVRDTPNYRVYTERWLPSCRTALRNKYGDGSNATILDKMPPRFAKIGEVAGLEMVSHDLAAGKSVVVYAKPTKKKRKAHKTPPSLQGIR